MAESDIKVKITLSPPLNLPPGYADFQSVTQGWEISMSDRLRESSSDLPRFETLKVDIKPTEDGKYSRKVTLKSPGCEEVTTETVSEEPLPQFDLDLPEYMRPEHSPETRGLGAFSIDLSHKDYCEIKGEEGSVFFTQLRNECTANPYCIFFHPDQLDLLYQTNILIKVDDATLKKPSQQIQNVKVSQFHFFAFEILKLQKVFQNLLVNKFPSTVSILNSKNEDEISKELHRIKQAIDKNALIYECIIEPIKDKIDEEIRKKAAEEQRQEEDKGILLEFSALLKLIGKICALHSSGDFTLQKYVELLDEEVQATIQISAVVIHPSRALYTFLELFFQQELKWVCETIKKEKADLILNLSKFLDDLNEQEAKHPRLINLIKSQNLSSTQKQLYYSLSKEVVELAHFPKRLFLDFDGRTHWLTNPNTRGESSFYVCYKDHIIWFMEGNIIKVQQKDNIRSINLKLTNEGQEKTFSALFLVSWIDCERIGVFAASFNDNFDNYCVFSLEQIVKLQGDTLVFSPLYMKANTHGYKPIYGFPMGPESEEKFVFTTQLLIIQTKKSISIDTSNSHSNRIRVDQFDLKKLSDPTSSMKTFILQPLLKDIFPSPQMDSHVNPFPLFFTAFEDILILAFAKYKLDSPTTTTVFVAIRVEGGREEPSALSSLEVPDFGLGLQLLLQKNFTAGGHTHIMYFAREEKRKIEQTVIALHNDKLKLATIVSPLDALDTLEFTSRGLYGNYARKFDPSHKISVIDDEDEIITLRAIQIDVVQ